MENDVLWNNPTKKGQEYRALRVHEMIEVDAWRF